MGLFSRIRSAFTNVVERVRSVFVPPAEVEPEIRPIQPEPRTPKRQNKRQQRRQERANTIYQKEINLASSGDSDTRLGDLGFEKAKIFYKATERLWEGHSLHERNDIIMQKLGFNSLQECMEYVLSKNKDAVDFARRSKGKGGYVGGAEDSSHITSPEYMALVIPVLS